MWWRMFERHEMSPDELYEDLDCLACLTRTATPPRAIKRSWGLEYGFDPDQDTKLRAGSECYVVPGTEPEVPRSSPWTRRRVYSS